MRRKTKGLVSPLQNRPDPPVFVRGALADHLMNMILDQQRCQACARLIDTGEAWGVIADVRRDDPESTAYIQAVRLCATCWSHPAHAVKQLDGKWA